MIKTQIYITEAEQKALKSIAARTGTKQSELIRRAIDQFIARFRETDRLKLLQQARGIWKDRTDLPDFRQIRRELDRIEV
ncbi:MAG: ribbon-helix-helix protein, CopG family [Calditrichaeota bacterium]|nr:ribbon-helix-helix protein, CopG family [Calditrichota bacterium]MCB0307172.1 ribbon-helix-helix protein, CopG family [Calditrichota bacterium]MCB0312135.1 ribbon-helix-helix protein, CopG family [Calditrichota bacterium]MCB9090486.1 ribbon-helix-helix protein, CopG family [Calditrichia bacterium]